MSVGVVVQTELLEVLLRTVHDVETKIVSDFSGFETSVESIGLRVGM